MADKARLNIRTLDLAIMDALEAWTDGKASATEAYISVYSTLDRMLRMYDHTCMSWEIDRIVNGHLYPVKMAVACGEGYILILPSRIKLLCDHGVYPVVEDDRVLCADGDEIVDVTDMSRREIMDFLGY